MCGIVGYTGAQDAASRLIAGLSNLEYRGYDSAGISLIQDDGIYTVKAQGRLQEMVDRYKQEGERASTCGIGHTRWATHGKPSDLNAHPHTTEKLALVHNGIIENYSEIKAFLDDKEYTFASDTDTEIACKLLDYHYQQERDPLKALVAALGQLEGSYAFAILFADHPDTVYATRQGSPLIAGVSGEGNFVASDVPAILAYTRDYYLLEEGEIAVVGADQVEVFDFDGNPVPKELQTAQWDIVQAQKSGFPHFMLKEIHEQPKALLDTIHSRVKDGLPNFAVDGLPDDFFAQYKKVMFVACGTAMYAGTVGRNLVERLARIPAEVDYASEFRYRDPILEPDTLVVIISQSGETADTLAALRLAKSQGIDTLAIVNVAGSTIAREADYVLHTYAGPEIAVASTKAFSVQIGLLCLVALELARCKSQLELEEIQQLAQSLLTVIARTEDVIGYSEALKELAVPFADAHSLFYMGRGIDHALAMEGSLKLKEISYIHSEAYAAGELKHGTISLITEGTPVIGLATQRALLPKTVSNIKEVRARGANVLLITLEGIDIQADVYDHIIRLPALEEAFLPLLTVIVLQLLAYHVAVAKGCDVDKPRNLAKSVTVE